MYTRCIMRFAEFNATNVVISFSKNINIITEKRSRVKIKCFECWQITIKSMIWQLWKKLKCYNFPYIRTRRINQDCVENFFLVVRQQGDNCLNFFLVVRQQGDNCLQHSDTQNCAADIDHMLSLISVSNESIYFLRIYSICI